jgi:hypothetical protein
MCEECTAFVDPKEQTPEWWLAKRFREILPASQVWVAAPYVDHRVFGQIYRAWKRS